MPDLKLDRVWCQVESALPVAVRPSGPLQGLKTVQGLLRSFTAQATPCALRLLVN
ncbi:Unknown protein sequence [Pseudomonas amygdali pv. morsprunorum]|nr:Unknown protein sequence [Pseudomonas amygdali pv. morsprunorum]RMV85995.1 hypothetical protein ALP04_102608 [Pseudomonas amygdali pv. sesami]